MDRKKITWALAVVFVVAMAALTYFVKMQDRSKGVRQAVENRLGPSEESMPQLRPSKPDQSWPFDQYPSADSYLQFEMLYLALNAEEPTQTQYANLAKQLSRPYRRLANTFEKQTLLEKLKPQMQASMALYRKRYFTVTKGIYLGHYDPESQSFPLYESMAAYSTWQLNDVRGLIGREALRLKASNQEKFSQFKVSDDALARKLEALSESQRRGSVKVYCYAQEVTDDPFGSTIQAQIVRVDILSRSGELIGTVI